MNQQRWNFLTALLLGTAISPISSVRAEVTTPAVSEHNDNAYSLQSSPSIVTPARTDVVVPVPQVSSLPSLVTFGKAKSSSAPNQLKIAKLGTLQPTKQRHIPSPVVPVAATAASFSNFRTTASIVAIPNPIDSFSSSVSEVAPLPQLATKASASGAKSFTSQAASAPIFVSRSDNAKLAKALLPPTITNSATVKAEMTVTPIIEGETNSIDKVTLKAATTIPPAITNSTRDRLPVTTVPKVAPLATYPRDRADTPSFESGLPVFISKDERPQQIVATAIAQVGNEIVAPELSIAIPVERPKQSSIPTRLPVSTPAISKIDSPAATVNPVLDKIVATQIGQASWYGNEGGNRTANGERYNPNGMTAAHRTLPFGTMVKVTNLKTGKSVVVRINDRGPFRSRRIVDLSAGAAEVIGLKSHGVGDVRMDILSTQG
jgi:rare lipoprotein A